MNRIEVSGFLRSFFAELKPPQSPADVKTLRPFLELILALKRNLPVSIPLLTDLAVITSENPGREAGKLQARIERRYMRLCRVQQELGRLNLKKAAAGKSKDFALEDYVFSQIDFSRYRELEEKEFERAFSDAAADFDDAFFRKNFNRSGTEIQSLIQNSYKKTDGTYQLQKGNPLILSVMRTLETSLESAPLLTAGEIDSELKNLFAFLDGSGEKGKLPAGAEMLYPLLVSSLDNVTVSHRDGMATKLFISAKGELSGTFRPGDKSWTLVLIPAELLKIR